MEIKELTDENLQKHLEDLKNDNLYIELDVYKLLLDNGIIIVIEKTQGIISSIALRRKICTCNPDNPKPCFQ